jgi:hypothetical protein
MTPALLMKINLSLNVSRPIKSFAFSTCGKGDFLPRI